MDCTAGNKKKKAKKAPVKRRGARRQPTQQQRQSIHVHIGSTAPKRRGARKKAQPRRPAKQEQAPPWMGQSGMPPATRYRYIYRDADDNEREKTKETKERSNERERERERRPAARSASRATTPTQERPPDSTFDASQSPPYAFPASGRSSRPEAKGSNARATAERASSNVPDRGSGREDPGISQPSDGGGGRAQAPNLAQRKGVTRNLMKRDDDARHDAQQPSPPPTTPGANREVGRLTEESLRPFRNSAVDTEI